MLYSSSDIHSVMTPTFKFPGEIMLFMIIYSRLCTQKEKLL
uniref:Uncharacterized protein n=1 Tax=Arundo donax TaxID=35708 RepID=A0A0A8Y1C7_ARUDO